MRRADNLHVPIVLKSGSLNLLEPSGPVQGLFYLLLEQEWHTGKYWNYSKYQRGKKLGFVEKVDFLNVKFACVWWSDAAKHILACGFDSKPISAEYADICIDKLRAAAVLSFFATARCHILCIFGYKLIRNERYKRKSIWTDYTISLTFRHRASSKQDRHFATLQRTLFIYLINKYISLSDICLTVHHWYK